MKHVNKIMAKVSGAPRIEFDPSVAAWYVRFKNTKVHKTLEESSGPIIVTIDIDANNDVVGIELIGVKEFSLELFRNLTQIDASRIDLNQARFVTTQRKQAIAA
jgi:uncharacterized protein YuzE